MSVTTRVALEAAIAAHLADERNGAFLIDYALIVSAATDEDFERHRAQYLCEYASGVPYHSSLGLVLRHMQLIERRGEPS